MGICLDFGYSEPGFFYACLWGFKVRWFRELGVGRFRASHGLIAWGAARILQFEVVWGFRLSSDSGIELHLQPSFKPSEAILPTEL